MSDLISFNPVRALDANGNPVAGARAFFYTSGTTTPVTVFSDAAEQTPHPSPLLAGAEGVFPPVFRSGQPIKVDVQTPGGESLNGFPLDPVLTVPASGAAASQVSFEPTENIPGTNVQAAIERVQENLVTDALNAIKEAVAPPALATTGDGAAYVLDPGADLRRATLDVYDQYAFRANADSTGAVTLDVTLADSTTGAIAVQRYVGDTLTALAAGDLVEGHHYAVQYDGAVWVLMTQLSAPSLSEAQATDPDDTTFGTVSGQRLAQARGAVVAPVEITSGDTIDFTAIPDHVREITLHFWGAVTSSNDDFHVQLVVGGTPITSGYTSAGVGFGSTSSNASGNSSSAFVLRRLNDSEVISGAAVLKKIGSNRWSFSAAGSRGIGVFLGGGHGDAGGVVDGLRILTAGSDTFSGGFWALEYRK